MNKTYLLVFLIIISAVIGTYWLTSHAAIQTGDSVLLSRAEYDELVAISQRFDKVIQLEEEIKKNYYLDTSEIDFDTAMYEGLFQALGDKYSTYFTPEDYISNNEGLSGEYTGIGTVIEAQEDGTIRVVSPIRGSPAAKAGIQPGDIIWKVDETELTGKTLDEGANLMRGQAGTKLVVYIRRDGEELIFPLVRAKIISPSVDWQVKDGNVGYLSVTHFESQTHKQFKEGLAELRAQGITSLVIDLRNNPGGYLHVVVDMADQILGKQTIVSVMSRNQKPEEFRSSGTPLDIPYVVLVNKGSASASEIFAGAVQDAKAAPIMGEVTTGKGLVQTAFKLDDGSGFRITTAYYLTPAGHNIHLKGIIPDINYADMAAKGYEYNAEVAIGSDDDRVLDYALDYLRGTLPKTSN